MDGIYYGTTMMALTLIKNLMRNTDLRNHQFFIPPQLE